MAKPRTLFFVLVGARTLESGRISALDARGAVVALEPEAGEAEVGPWEPLSIKDKRHRIARRAAR